MKRFLIGAGGWAYFQVPGLRPLVAYSKAFNFVEVNSTFYDYPKLNLVRYWRRLVPPEFQFAVRCHQELTHRSMLEPVSEAFSAVDKMTNICKILNAEILLLQTPPHFRFDKSKITSIRNFFQSVDFKGVRIAWEVRRAEPKTLEPDLITLMRDFNLVHCVDVSRESPAFESDVLYTRLFGKGVKNIYQFTDNELKDIDSKAAGADYKKVAMSFHGVAMYKDAARYKIYKKTGRFPVVTKSTGLDSLREVLRKDARFPYTKEELIRHQGWKVIDFTEEERVHASTILKKLPEKNYQSLEDVIQDLKLIIETSGTASSKKDSCN